MAQSKIVTLESFFSFGQKVKCRGKVGHFLGSEGEKARFFVGKVSPTQIKNWTAKKSTKQQLPGVLVKANEIQELI